MSTLRTRAAVLVLAVVAGVASVEGSAAAAPGSPARAGVSASVTKAPSAHIVNPRNGSWVPVRVTASGTGYVQRGTYLWLAVWSPAAHRWYPQQSVKINSAGRWSGTVNFGTSATRHGEAFGMGAFQASSAANAAMERYLANGRRTGRWPGLVTMPSRTMRLAGIAVRRR